MPIPHRIVKQRVSLKHIAREMLIAAGFKAWNITRPTHQMYSFLIIACNRLCPSKPERAYMMLDNHLRFARQKMKIDPTKWRCADREGQEGLRLMAVKLQGQLQDHDHCPCCGATWTPDPELLDNVYDAESDTVTHVWHPSPVAAQYQPHPATSEGGATHRE